MIRTTHLAPAALAAMLALPAAGLAQAQAQSDAATPPATAPSAAASRTALGNGAEEQRVEEHIKKLRAELQITAAEEPQWQQFVNVMRENAKDMDQMFSKRAAQYSTMNALQNMQSYAEISEAHARHVQKLVPAFETLYDAMPAPQKQLTDEVFRANAAAHTRKRTKTEQSEDR
jgi:hypothetical protein